MKQLIAFALILLTFGAFAQDLQLDSIIIVDEQDILDYYFAFEYENDKLVKYIEDDVEVSINYTDFDKMNKWLVKIDDDEALWTFFYNDDQVRDTLLIESEVGNSAMWTYEYENSQLSKLTLFVLEGSTFVEVFWQAYSYQDNETRIEEYVFYGNQGILIETRILEFSGDGKLLKVKYIDDNNVFQNYDSLSYSQDGSLEQYQNIAFSSTGPLEPTNISDFLSDASVNFQNILTPVSLLQVITQSGLDPDYVSLLFPILYGNKIDNHIRYGYSSNTMATWYYSIFVENKEERVSAVPLAIFPNPTIDRIRIESDEIMASYEIYNMLGTMMQQGTSISNTVEVQGLSAGQYTIVCSNKSGEYFFAQFVKN